VKHVSRTIINTDEALGRGMDFAFVTVLFLGIGFMVDRWLGTTPVFMIALVMIALVGQFARIWFGYDASMRRLEAEHAANTHGRTTQGARTVEPAAGEGVGA